MQVRTAVDADTETTADVRLCEPQVLHNRLMKPLWLKLRRHGDPCVASYSFDGVRWQEAATVEVRLGQTIRAGLMAASGLENVSTTVMFDKVAIPSSECSTIQQNTELHGSAIVDITD